MSEREHILTIEDTELHAGDTFLALCSDGSTVTGVIDAIDVDGDYDDNLMRAVAWYTATGKLADGREFHIGERGIGYIGSGYTRDLISFDVGDAPKV